VDKQSNSYITSSFFGSAAFAGVALETDAYYQSFILKHTPSGELSWAISSQGLNPLVNRDASVAAYARNTRLAADSTGSCFIAGLFHLNEQFGATLLAGPRTPGVDQLFVARILDPDTATQEVQLQIARTTDGLWLTWPASAIGFGLQSTSSPADAPSWLPLPAAPVTVGDQNSVKVNVSDTPTFYRLIKPIRQTAC
jgi:hypothetical protein